MKQLSLIASIIFFSSVLISCDDDDDDTSSENIEITVENFTTEIEENPANGDILGTITASVNVGELTFSITSETPTGAISVNETSGQLTVLDATLFDYEVNPSISATISATSDEVSQNLTVTVNLTNLTDSPEELDEITNQAEERDIPIAELENGISVAIGEVKSGSPPASSTTIEFEIENEQRAQQDFGFIIELSTAADFEGIYIQLVANDGSKASSYFDVPAFAAFGGRIAQNKKSNKRTALTGKTYDLEVPVSFGSIVQPGTFCYEICLYAPDGTVGQVETVCVEVEAWGGNSELVGEWLFDRYEPEEFDDDDYEYELQCTNGETILVMDEIAEADDWTFVLNEDGTYYEEYYEKGDGLNNEASEANCEAIYDIPYEETERYIGQWSFDEDNGLLTVVDFEYQNLTFPEYDEVYAEGDLYIEGEKAYIEDGNLVIEGEDDGLIIKVIFTPKN